jgi:acyl-coenzyme A synthetase/AMP-(fatty) acid ligase
MQAHAYAVVRPGHVATPELAGDVLGHAHALLPGFKRPRTLAWRDALPRTSTGKLQRYRLRAEGG